MNSLLIQIIVFCYCAYGVNLKVCYRKKNRHKVQVRMRTIPSVQHCVTKKGIGSMMVLRSYLTTIRNSVTVMAATIHAC